MSRTNNREENHHETPNRPIFSWVATEPQVPTFCPYCGRGERAEWEWEPPTPTCPPVEDLVPDAEAIRSAFQTLVWLMEVLDARRPWRQVAHLASPTVGRYLRGMPINASHSARASRVVSLHPSQPHRCRIETASSVEVRVRRRALAASFEMTGEGEWICTTVRIL
jgi:hypothetical protein